MLILCLDSSGPVLRTGLFEDHAVLSEISSERAGDHSERAIPQIERMLSQTGRHLGDVNILAVNLGPGSFTGLRIGLAICAGISCARNIPLAGFTSFEIMKNDLVQAEGEFLAVIPCRKDEFYAVLYKAARGMVELVSEPWIVSPKEYAISDGNLILIGPGSERFYDQAVSSLQAKLTRNSEMDTFPTLKSLAACAQAKYSGEMLFSLSMPEIYYLVPSQAEVNLARRRSDCG